MTNCPQNNVMTALLLANKSSRETILPIIESIRNWDEINAILKKKELEATVHSLFLFWDQWKLYKQPLTQKYIGAFTRRGQIEQANLQKLLNQIDKQIPADMQLTMDAIKAMGLWEINIKEVSNKIQNRLINDYVYNVNGIMKINDKEVSKKEFLDHYTKLNEVPDSVKADPLYQAINGIYWRDSLRQYVVYKAMTDWDISWLWIKGKWKEVYDFRKINKRNLDSLILPNLDNPSIVEEATKRYKQLMEAEGIGENMVINYGKMNPEEMITEATKSLQSKLDYLNGTNSTKLNIEDFKSLLRTTNLENIDKEIDKAIEDSFIRELQRPIAEWWRWIKNPTKKSLRWSDNSAIRILKWFMENFYRSWLDVTQFWTINALLDRWYKVFDKDAVIFVNPWVIAKWKGKQITDAFSKLKWKYSMDAWEIRSVDINELDDFMKTEEWKKIRNILVPTKSDVENMKWSTYHWVTISSPKEWQSAIFDVEDNRLKIKSDNKQVIDDLRKYSIDNWSIPNIVENPNSVWDSWDSYVKWWFPNKSVEEIETLQSFIKWGRWTPNDLERSIAIATLADNNSLYQYIDPVIFKANITAEDIAKYIKYFTWKDVIWIELNDEIKDIYMRSIISNSNSPAKDIAEGQIALLQKLWIENIVEIPKNIDLKLNALNTLFNNDYSITIRGEWLDEIIAWIQNNWELIKNTQFMNSMLSSNPWKTEQQIFDIIKQSVNSYNPIQAEPTIWVGKYFVKNYERYWESIKNLMENIDIYKSSNVQWKKNIRDKTLEEVINTIDEYSTDVKNAVDKYWNIPFDLQKKQKNRLLISLREKEILLEQMGFKKWQTYVYSIPWQLNWEGLDVFDELIDRLKKKYTDEVINFNEAKKLTPLEQIKANWEIVIPKKDWGNIVIPADDTIEEIISQYPVWVDMSIVREMSKTMNNEEKSILVEALIEWKKRIKQSQDLWTLTLNAYVPWLWDTLNKYKNVNIDISGKNTVLPWILTSNSTELPNEADLIIKSKIYRDVSEEVKKNILSGKKLEEIIRTALDWNEWITEDIINSYFNDFSIYTVIPKLDDSILKEAMSQTSPIISQKADFLLSQIKYKNPQWEIKSLNELTQINPSEYPDVFYKTKGLYNTKEIQWINFDREAVSTNVKRAYDNVYNWFKYSDSVDDVAFTWVKRQANEVMKQTARLQNVSNMSSQLISSWLRLKDAFNPFLNSISSWWNHIAEMFWIPTEFDAKYIWEMLNNYEDLIKLSDQQFNDLKKEWLNINAYNVAYHYRLQKKLLSWITNNPQVNKILVQEIDDKMKDIVEIVDWKRKFKKDWEFQGIYKLRSNITAAKNWALLHWSQTLRDIWIWYKKSQKWIFWSNVVIPWFWSEFFDEWLDSFNQLFNSKLNLQEYRIVTGAIMWDIIHNAFYGLPKWIQTIGNIANSPLARNMATFPWWYVTWLSSWAWYINTLIQWRWLNWDWWDYSWVDDFMRRAWILQGSGIDLTSAIFKNENSSKNPIEEIIWLFPSNKTFNLQATRDLIWQGFDNGQNIIDWIFGWAMKRQAFVTSLRSEWFTSMSEFENMLNNPKIDQAYKKAKFDAVVNKAYDVHEGLINYVGRWISQNIDTGNLGSKVSWILQILTNPINFRAWLGNNAILNTFWNFKKLAEYWLRYNKVDDVSKLIANDPVMMQFMLWRIQDTAMALKLSNLNDYWEWIQDRQLEMNDIVNVLNIASQQTQFFWMSAVWRLWWNIFTKEWYGAYDFLSEYALNSFRNLKTSRRLIELARVASTWNTENFNAYVDKMIREIWTAWARYVIQDRWDMIISPDQWLTTLFGWENKFQDFSYEWGNGSREAVFNKKIQEGKYWESIRDLMRGTTAWIITKSAVTAWLSLLPDWTELKVKQLFWLDAEKSYIDSWIAVTDFMNSEESKKFVNGKYQFENVLLREHPELYAEKAEEIKSIIDRMKLPYTIWDTEFADMIDSFKQNWTSAFTTKNWYKVYEDESMTQLLQSMQNDGVLDDVYSQVRWTRDKNKTKLEVTNYINSYITQHKDNIDKYDWLKEKISLSYLYDKDVINWSDEQKNELKKLLWVKKVSLNDLDRLQRNSDFVSNYFNHFQGVYSDWNISSVWLDTATDLFAKRNPEINKAFFDYETVIWLDWKQEIKIKGFKKEYETALRNKYQFEDALARWEFKDSTVIKWIYWPYSLYSVKEGGKFNKEANIEWLMHWIKFVNGLRDMSEEDRNYLKIRMAASLWDWALSIKDMESKFPASFVEEYRREFLQSYETWTRIMDAIADQWQTKWGKVWWGVKISLSWLASSLKNIKKYISKNEVDMYKPMVIPKGIITPYILSNKTKWELALRPPQIPSYSTKSEKIIKTKNSKTTSTELKPVKVKVLKVSKTRWAK